MKKTCERISPDNLSSFEDYLIYLRHLVAYRYLINKLHKNIRVLEVGCGEGYGSVIISKKTDNYYGIDVDKETIRYAIKKYGSYKRSFKSYNGSKIPWNNNYFDIVVSFQVIEHVRNVGTFLSEIKRVIKNNGKFYCTTPNRNYRLFSDQKPWNKFHLREYTYTDLSVDLNKYFKSVELMGIRGIRDVQIIEKARVAPYLLSQPNIHINLKNMNLLIKMVFNLILYKFLLFIKYRRNFAYKQYFRLEDFYITNNNIASCLDYFAICRK